MQGDTRMRAAEAVVSAGTADGREARKGTVECAAAARSVWAGTADATGTARAAVWVPVTWTASETKPETDGRW